MKWIGDLLKAKGRHVWCIGPADSVLDAIKLMAEKEIGALAVTDGDRLKGIFSERDYTRKIVLRGRSSTTTTVSEVMTAKVAVIDSMKTVEECMALMTHMHVRHLPVMDGGKLAGMISIGDLVKAIIAEQRFVIEQLENYISGTPPTLVSDHTATDYANAWSGSGSRGHTRRQASRRSRRDPAVCG